MAKDEQPVREEKHGLAARMVEGVKEGWENLRVGDGHMQAMVRLGLKELRNAFNPSRESAADNEIGLYGTATQGEIADARGGPGGGPEQETLSVDKLRAEAQEKAKDNQRGREGPEQDRSMER